MDKQILGFVTAMTVLSTVSSTWATPYNFTFTGADLMQYTIAFAPDGTTPAGNHIYDGALTFTPNNGNSSSSWLASSNLTFFTMTHNSHYGLAMFNLWGFGGPNAAAWGETFSIDSWTDSGTATMGWASGLFADAGTLGHTVLGFGQTYTGKALSFYDPAWPTFTFTLDLPNTTSWYNNKAGELVFWFGGYMISDPNNPDSDIVGKLQGNMILDGQPVPEPATMLLLGAGLAGLAALGRRNKKTIS